MRASLLTSSAGALATVGMVGLGLWWHVHTASARPHAEIPAPRPALRTLAPVEKAPYDQLQRQIARLTEGNVVLDMRILESLDAAGTLVDHWRSTHPADAHLVCWLAAANDPALVTAVRALSETGCNVLRVALVEVPDTTE